MSAEAIGLIRFAGLTPMPWKNGGGTTRELRVHPPGATVAGFDWRISMADVPSDGPFSVFPGIDRTLVLLDGVGIDLLVAGETHRLDAAHPMLSFPGDVPVASRLVEGPIRDVNVMTRRGAFEHRVTRAEAGAIRVEGATILIGLGSSTLTVEETDYVLERGDAVELRAGSVGTLSTRHLRIEIVEVA